MTVGLVKEFLSRANAQEPTTPPGFVFGEPYLRIFSPGGQAPWYTIRQSLYWFDLRSYQREITMDAGIIQNDMEQALDIFLFLQNSAIRLAEGWASQAIAADVTMGQWPAK